MAEDSWERKTRDLSAIHLTACFSHKICEHLISQFNEKLQYFFTKLIPNEMYASNYTLMLENQNIDLQNNTYSAHWQRCVVTSTAVGIGYQKMVLTFKTILL